MEECRVLLPVGTWPAVEISNCPAQRAILPEDLRIILLKVWNRSVVDTYSEHRFPAPSSARFSYATEGALFISAQLSTDAVSALRKVSGTTNMTRSNLAPKHACKHETHPPRVKEEFRLDSNDYGFVCASVNLAAMNDTPCFIRVVCNKLTAVWAPTKNCSLGDSFLDPMA